jgi:CRISPR-associated protein Cas1
MVDRVEAIGRVLVVDGYGVTLNVERGHLVVRDGFPAEDALREVRFARGKSEVDRVIVRAPAGTLSIAALDWCTRMGVTVAIVGSDSRLINCLIPDGAHDGPLRRAQAISGTTDDALKLARWLLRRKLQSQLDAIGPDASRRSQLAALMDAIERDETLTELLIHEGLGAQIYSDSTIGTPLPWPSWAHSRIPTHWRLVSPRVSGGRNRVRDARDPFNALLNYGYTLLEVETRIACAAEGLDPDLGYLHVDARLRESFVYDLLEPLRVEVERLTLEWTRSTGERRSRGLRPWMFIELRDGIVRLDPDAARRYARAVMPRLRDPALRVAGDFATQLRRVTIPYRLIVERAPQKRPGTRAGVGAPCEYCKQPLPKLGLKFCGRTCYLRHSVEIRRPIEEARRKLAEMRADGLTPGHGGEAAKKRGAAAALTCKRQSLGLTPEELRARRSQQQRQYRSRTT